VRGLTRPARLEPRVAGTPGEERAERLVLVPERLLQGTEEISDRNARSGSFFIAVSAASDAA